MKTKGLLSLALVLGFGASLVSADYLVRIPLATSESIYRVSQPGLSGWEDLGTCAIARVRADALKDLEAQGFRPQVLDEVNEGGAYYTAYTVTPAGEAVLSEWGRVLCRENGASVVWVRDPDNFVMNKGPLMLRRLGRPLVLERPQGGPSLGMPLNPFVQAMVAAVRVDSTMAALRRLQRFRTRYSTTDSGRAASIWTRDKYRAYRAHIPQDTAMLHSWNSTQAQNVVLERPGFVHPETIAVIGGHIDSYSTGNAPGSDDNGTGTVAAIEAARVMKNYDFELTARFCAFAGEEQGLLGSDSLAGLYRRRGDRIVGMINYDMIGHVDASPESLDVIGRTGRQDTVLMKFVKAAADSYTAMKVVFQNSGLTGSDHASFWSQGWTATCQIEDYPLHNPSYHTAGDTIGTGPNPGMNDSLWFVEAVKSGVAAFALLCRPFRSNGVEAGSALPGVQPRELALLPMQPNPTTGSVAIRFLLPRPGKFSVEVYDLAGRLVKQVKAGEQMPGEHRVTWGGKDSHGAEVPSGVYFVKLQARDGVRTGRLVLVR